MRFEEKQRARELRRQGWSYNDILKEVGVSKSTLSLWLRDIPLTEEQIAALACKFRAGRERFIHKMRVRRDTRWAAYHREAEEEYLTLSQDPVFMFGLALYIGEGTRRSRMICVSRTATRASFKRLWISFSRSASQMPHCAVPYTCTLDFPWRPQRATGRK
jgi:transcriptional regulator with XRE-family HTH domain